MLSIIISFQDDMEAVFRVGDTITNRFEVRNDLRQDCTMAPTLFNLYFNAMVYVWHVPLCMLQIMLLLNQPGDSLLRWELINFWFNCQYFQN